VSSNAIILVKKTDKIIVSLYSKFDGHPFFIGKTIKESIFKCIRMSDYDFNNIRYNKYIDSLPKEKRPDLMDLDAILDIKYPKEPIVINGIEIHGAIANERTLSTRLVAGLYNKYEDDDCPNTIQINTNTDASDITYHYDITLKKDKVLGIIRPYIKVTVGFEGDVLYKGFIDDWNINETED
jgi:hypothetical protein